LVPFWGAPRPAPASARNVWGRGRGLQRRAHNRSSEIAKMPVKSRETRSRLQSGDRQILSKPVAIYQFLDY
jgi:hypothetical protein